MKIAGTLLSLLKFERNFKQIMINIIFYFKITLNLTFLLPTTELFYSLHNVANFPKILQYIMAYYLDFVQLLYILLTFGFAFGPFESLPQNFGLL